MKYTRNVIQDAVDHSVSFAGVLRFLNLRQAGGTQSYIKKVIDKYKIDVSHFTGQGHQKGKRNRKKHHWSAVLVYNRNNGMRERIRLLRTAMMESGIEYKCCECGNVGEWNDKPLRLEVDHIDGDFLNNLRKNLRFVCPNCHSQYSTSSSSRLLKLPE